MRSAITLSVLAACALLFASATQAQNERRERRPAGSNPAPAPSQSAAPASSQSAVKRTWDFTKRFGIPQYGDRAGCANDLAGFDRFLADYNGQVDAFLAGPTDPKKLNLERKNYVRQVLGTERSIIAYLGTYEETGKRSPDGMVAPLADDLCRAKLQRNNLIAIREGLKAMKRVYPDMAEVGPALAQVNAALAQIGDDKAIERHVAGNRSGSLAAVRLKPPLTRNAEWERGLQDGFKRLVPGETVLKLHLYSANWYVHKNELTSVPEYRQIGAWVATKRGDSTCWIHGIDLWQNYVGGGRFDSGEYKLGRAPQQILCENV